MMAVESITCPDCGLTVRVTRAQRSRLVYDVKEWRRRCKRIDVSEPVWCLVQRDGTTTKKAEQASNSWRASRGS
jgi:hypothetical protein